MALTGKEYEVIGLLNTNWGDFGNINTLTATIPCLIYGAEFAWNSSEVSYEELNEAISVVEYHDDSKKIMSILDQLAKTQIVNWTVAVGYLESKKTAANWIKDQVTNFFNYIKVNDLLTAIKASEQLNQALYSHLNKLKYNSCSDLLLMGNAITIFNEIGLIIKNEFYNQDKVELNINRYQLATKLETWYHDYKISWRKDSKESELFRIGEVIFAYADLLRTI
jgi:hypothetical protein